MHKTGSTSVQASLAAVADPVGWKYLTVGGSQNMGGSLYAMFAGEPHKYYWFLKRGDTPERVAKYGAKLRVMLAKAVEECTAENIIISGESLSLIEDQGILALREFLKPLCDEIRVIGYVRPPIGFKISFFQQQIKHRVWSFDFRGFRLKYIQRFKKFDDIFGSSNVVLRKFDPAMFTNQCVVSDFCEQVGIPAPDLRLVVRVNESLCREACAILYAYRKFGPNFGVGKDVIKESKLILAPFFAMQGTKFTVSKEMVTSSLALDEEDLRWMEERLGETLREEIANDGTELASEEDLLRIERSSCVEFAARFQEMYNISVPADKIPEGEVINPQRVADFIEYCQSLCRERIREMRALKPKRVRKKRGAKVKKLGFWARCWKYFRTVCRSSHGR